MKPFEILITDLFLARGDKTAVRPAQEQVAIPLSSLPKALIASSIISEQ